MGQRCSDCNWGIKEPELCFENNRPAEIKEAKDFRKEKYSRKQQMMALKIQALWRGYKIRKILKYLKKNKLFKSPQNPRKTSKKIAFPDGSYYLGSSYKNQENGFGTFVNTAEEKFSGCWKDGRSNGKGVFIKKTVIIKGDWLNNTQTGYIEEHWQDGSIFKGFCTNSQKNGFGMYKLRNVYIYSGYWNKNQFHGFGTCSWADGRKYSGFWNQNDMHGKGIFTWKDGKKYEGNYENNMRSGTGKMSWPDGKKYQGEWKRGKMHGRGAWTGSDGKKIKGEWRLGEMLEINSP